MIHLCYHVVWFFDGNHFSREDLGRGNCYQKNIKGWQVSEFKGRS